MNASIAIVGMACCYADAASPAQLWRNVLARRRAFRRIPAERLNLADYYAEDPTAADAIYSTQAAVIEGYNFDRLQYAISAETYHSTDMTHWLALDIAAKALQDAGFTRGEQLPKATTGVLVGNTLTGEFSRASLLRLRWPYVNRLVRQQLQESGLDAAAQRAFMATLETRYKQPFYPVGSETLAGGLANTIAGRICNYFDFGGGGYTLDGACSSSLLAITNACTALQAGDLDVALVGGVDLSLDPFELVGFAKTQALARQDMRVYDANAQGFWPGEGCGFVLLMRASDASAQNLRCYASIAGWGVSSDGHGGMTRPEIAGQRLAIERAYARAGFGPDRVTLFEGHGTGTAVGDAVELQALSQARRDADPQAYRAYIGSIKANIGHTKAAAGIAGLLKASMALQQRVIPPATGVQQPHPLFATDAQSLQLSAHAMPWPQHRDLRAGVSAFGFGGVNVHLALQGEAAHSAQTPVKTPRYAKQHAELILLAAENLAQLSDSMQRLCDVALRISLGELTDLAAHLALHSGAGHYRVAVIAATPDQLRERLQRVQQHLQQGDAPLHAPEQGVFYRCARTPLNIAFMFPGQGSPAALPEYLIDRFAAVKALYQQVGLHSKADISAQNKQLAITCAQLAGLIVLEQFGVCADQAVGHSLGELTALHWASVMDRATLLRTVAARGRIMQKMPGPPGGMASIGADAAQTQALVSEVAEVDIACLNSDRQTIVSGQMQALLQLLERANAGGHATTLLNVSHGFHSDLIAPAVAPFAQHLRGETFSPVQARVISTVTGAALRAQTEIPALLLRQLTDPVLFVDAAKQLTAHADLCIEVGHGAVLTGLLRDVTTTPALALHTTGTDAQGLLACLAAVFTAGRTIATQTLYQDRLVKPYAFERALTFFANPCETHVSDAPTDLPGLPPQPAPTDKTTSHPAARLDISALLRRQIAQRTQLPLDRIDKNSRLLADLHLNSITVGQIINEMGNSLNMPPFVSPFDFANATVAQVALAFEDLLKTQTAAPTAKQQPMTQGVDAWVRAFEVVLCEAAPLHLQAPRKTDRDCWHLHGAYHGLDAKALIAALNAWGGVGVLMCVEDFTEADIPCFLQAAGDARATQSEYFVLLGRELRCASLARTFYLENPEIITCVLDLPLDGALPDRVVNEVRAATHFHEIIYTDDGRRLQPQLQKITLPETSVEPLSPDDLLLVSGGGKGVAAESALALAQRYGVRLLLLGRSAPATDAMLQENLARFTRCGVSFHYLRVDVTDRLAVGAVLEQAQADHGAISAILHGAGVNRPALLEALDADAFAATLRPKIQGLAYILAAIDPHKMRLLVTFGSIIARMGMRGEADYALANQWLDDKVRAYAQQHPHCHCLNVEWSVWSGVGMGERLGRIEALTRDGVQAISPDMGVQILLNLLAHRRTCASVVVSGRMPQQATLPLSRPTLPDWRFLERPRVYFPGVELVVDAHLSLGTDAYLLEHALHDAHVLPAVMGLEAMAQGVCALCGETTLAAFEQVVFAHPIVLPQSHKATLRIAVLLRTPTQVDVVLRYSETQFKVDHFSATCQLRACTSPRSDVQLSTDVASPVALDPAQLYASLFFHSGRFCRLQGYALLEMRRCVVDIKPPQSQPWFGAFLSQTLLLGDPASRDVALHAIQACVPHRRLLPVGVDCIRLDNVNAPGPWRMQAVERWRTQREYCYDVVIRAHTGEIREHWFGLRLQDMEALHHARWRAPLLSIFLTRKLAELLPDTPLRILLVSDPEQPRRARKQQALAQLLGDEQPSTRIDGKPQLLDAAQGLSLAHTQALTLALYGDSALACDIECVVGCEEEVWAGLLGVHIDLAQCIQRQMQEPLETAATRVWAARECLKKIGVAADAPLILQQPEADGWLMLSAGSVQIATVVVMVEGESDPIVIAVVGGCDNACL